MSAPTRNGTTTTVSNDQTSSLNDSGAVGGGQQGTVLTRTLYINITGTLANLAMAGPSGGTWKLVDGKQIGVFGVGSEVDTQVRSIIPGRA